MRVQKSPLILIILALVVPTLASLVTSQPAVAAATWNKTVFWVDDGASPKVLKSKACGSCSVVSHTWAPVPGARPLATDGRYLYYVDNTNHIVKYEPVHHTYFSAVTSTVSAVQSLTVKAGVLYWAEWNNGIKSVVIGAPGTVTTVVNAASLPTVTVSGWGSISVAPNGTLYFLLYYNSGGAKWAIYSYASLNSTLLVPNLSVASSLIATSDYLYFAEGNNSGYISRYSINPVDTTTVITNRTSTGTYLGNMFLVGDMLYWSGNTRVGVADVSTFANTSSSLTDLSYTSAGTTIYGIVAVDNGGPLSYSGGDYGTIVKNTTSYETVTVTNAGNSAVLISQINTYGTGISSSFNGNCYTGNYLDPNETCTVIIAWSPSSAFTLSDGSLEFSLGVVGAESATSTKSLSGTALNQALTPSPTAQTQVSVPTPLQRSSINPLENSEVSPSGGVISVPGNFQSEVVNIALNGSNLPQGSWKIVGGELLITVPSGNVGSAELQIYNGQAPLLPVQKFTYREITAPAPIPTETTQPTPTPMPTNTAKPTPMPTPSPSAPTLPSGFKVYFDMNSAQLSHVALHRIAAVQDQAAARKLLIIVTGFVQPTKANPNERALSLARATSVVREMKRLGIDATYLVQSGGTAEKNAASSRYASIEFKAK